MRTRESIYSEQSVFFGWPKPFAEYAHKPCKICQFISKNPKIFKIKKVNKYRGYEEGSKNSFKPIKIQVMEIKI